MACVTSPLGAVTGKTTVLTRLAPWLTVMVTGALPSPLRMDKLVTSARGSTKVNRIVPPPLKSSGQVLSLSWMMSRFPNPTQFSDGDPGTPPVPDPGPATAQFWLGEPSCGSPSPFAHTVLVALPTGWELSKIRACAPGAKPPPAFGVAVMITPKTLTRSPTYIPLAN